MSERYSAPVSPEIIEGQREVAVEHTCEYRLIEILTQSETLMSALASARELQLPSWYLGSGCITQTVWNQAHSRSLAENILDFDFVYFDPTDLSKEAEQRAQDRIGQHVLGIPFEVVNQARVHVWHEEYFGYPIHPHTSTEQSIQTWPTTASAVGARLEPDNRLTIYAPFGLDDLLGLVIRPNKVKITREIYEGKVARWSKHWPKLKIIPWEEVPDSE